jgi:hypothetical protein
MLDFRRNLAQPFLSAICPSLMASDSCLEIIYLIVCGSKLIREINAWRVAEMAGGSEYRSALKTTAHCTNEYPDDIQKCFRGRGVPAR